MSACWWFEEQQTLRHHSRFIVYTLGKHAFVVFHFFFFKSPCAVLQSTNAEEEPAAPPFPRRLGQSLLLASVMKRNKWRLENTNPTLVAMETRPPQGLDATGGSES